MKYLILILLPLLISCSSDLNEDECMTYQINNGNIELTVIDPNSESFYYLSIKTDSIGIINIQFPSSYKITYPHIISDYVLFETDTDNTKLINILAQEYYQGIINSHLLNMCHDNIE